jgi:transposase
LAKEKPPIFGMLQRGGAVVIRMLENVRQATIGPLIERTIAKGTLVYTDEYDIYSRMALNPPQGAFAKRLRGFGRGVCISG